MPNSELFLVKEGQEDIANFETVTRPMLKFQNECHDDDSKSSQQHYQARKEEKKEEEGEEEHSDRKQEFRQPAEASIPDEDDGFRTPTSLDHRIPEAKQCPPAPRKPKPSLKRKASLCNSSCSRRHPLELSKEVEILFQTQHNPPSDSHQSTKKARRDDPK